MSHLEDDASVDIEEMLKKADCLSAAMHGKKVAKPQPTKPVAVDPMEEMLKRAEKLEQEMKGELLAHESGEHRQNGSTVDPIDSMLALAGSLAAQMRTSNTGTSETSAKSLIVSTFELPEPSKGEDLVTPRLAHTVSTDDGSDGVDTMLLKAELLSKTIRSAANGHIDTPELIRASDEILLRARAKEGARARAAMESTASTPELLARAKTILDAPLDRVMSGDRTLNTQNNSMDTDLIFNSKLVPPSLLTRPPLPPNQRFAPPVTPSPKGTQFILSPSNTVDTQKESSNIQSGGHLAHAIEALQSVPTKKAPDSPIMPKSVALQRVDSDDISSVGSGSFMRNMSASNLQQRGSPECLRAVVATSECAAESLDGDDDDESRSKMVSYAEDVAKQMADALEETLSCSSSVGMHSESPAQPRKLLTIPPSRFKNVRKVNADKEEIIRTELFKASLEMDRSHSSWERHNAAVLEPREIISSNDMLRRKKLEAKVKWETVHIPESTDEDYVPMQDFRNCAYLGFGELPTKPKSSKRRKTKRKKLIRALVVGMLCLMIVLLASKLWHSSSSVPTVAEPPAVVKKAAHRKIQEKKAAPKKTKAPLSIQRDPPVEIKSKPTPSKKMKTAPSVPREPPIAKKVDSAPPRKTQTTASVQREPPALKKAPAAQVIQVPIKNEVVDEKDKATVPADAVATTEVILISLKDSLGDGNDLARTAPEKIKTPNRCFVPLGYLAFSKCRQITKKQPLFDAQAFVDSMLQ